jgi:hypothetical protein
MQDAAFSAASQSDLPEPGAFFSEGETEVIATLDLSGAHGQNGVDGTSDCLPPPQSGTDGHRGGNATRATPGKVGASAICQIGYASSQARNGRTGRTGRDGDANQFVIRFESTSTEERRSNQNQQSLPIGENGYIFIDTSGGRGGNGGRGGDGGPGSNGYRGRDATRYSNGGNGGPGGDGGDAGEPTDGDRGGDGGDVTLRIRDTDLGLLMLAKGNLSGGLLGFAGEPGRGGAGGPGGKGGDSYSWTETSSYRDSNGNTQTRTTFHTNPGGWDGSDGQSGRGSSYRARDGQTGADGRLRIEVVDDNQNITTYDSPYDLELVSFDIASEYSVIEPDSLVSIDNLMVRNCGGMPTPANYTVRVFIERDEWLLVDGCELVLHRSLQPGDTFCFDRCSLRMRIADCIITEPRNQSFRLRHPVNPVARMESGIRRPFVNFENGEDIRVHFPVELTPLVCLNSLAPGESTRVIWGVKNVSDETFDQTALHRAVRTRMRTLVGDVNPELIVFFDDKDEPATINGVNFEHRVGKLASGETTVIEVRIGVRDDPSVIPYQGFSIGMDCDLQRPGSSEQSDQYRRVDYRQSFIRVSERYRRDSESRFLLVANEKTTSAEIEKWTQLADYFGSGLDVWDVSYYGFIDLVRAVDRDKSLLDQWQGMTMIIPNNYFTTPEGKTVAFEQLAKGQFLRAAADHDINFYIVGDSRTGGADRLAQSLIPVDNAKSASQLKTQKEFLAEVKRWNHFVSRSQQVVGGITSNSKELADVSLGSVHQFPIRKRTMLFQPKASWLEAEAKRLQRKLSKEDPLHRWIIVHRYDIGNTDPSWGFFRKRQVGTLEVRRTLDATKGSAVLYEVDGIDAIDPEFIDSEPNKHGIFLALKFEDKVDRFIRLASQRIFPRLSEQYIDRPLSDAEVRKIGGELVDSILTDLYNEQKTARQCRTWGRSGVRDILPKLNYLAERSLNYGVNLEQMQANPTSMALLYDLLANLRHMAIKSQTIWDSAIVPTAFFKRSRAVSKVMLERTDRIATNIFGRAPSWWDRASSPNDEYNPFGTSRVKSPRGILRQTADKEIKTRLNKRIQDRVPVTIYAAAQDHEGLTYDPELLTESTRVMTGEQFDQIAKAETVATTRRTATEIAVKAERADLLVPLPTAQSLPKSDVQTTQAQTTAAQTTAAQTTAVQTTAVQTTAVR